MQPCSSPQFPITNAFNASFYLSDCGKQVGRWIVSKAIEDVIIFTQNTKNYKLNKTGKYIQKSLRPSREAWLGLDRQSLFAEKRKCFN